MFFGTAISVLLWWFPDHREGRRPDLVVLNALPKVALGPVIIIWAGAGVESIIIMTLAISLITTIIGIYGGLKAVESEKLMLMQTFGANKKQILFKVLLPASYANILSRV
jgi:NitT/TauT family transport system permease protein